MAYAERTEVAVEKSIQEIITLVKRAGAVRIGQMEEPDGFAIQLFLKDRMLRFRVQYPALDTMPTHDGRNSRLTDAQRKAKWEQTQRQRARALRLVIQAKLESVESGVESFEEAFLANVVMNDNLTVAEHVLGRIADSYERGGPPQLLLGAPS